ncbi:DnaJ domain-containing protein [Rhizobium tumorigenes]|uniref:DnaJ domain-containing protein n=1 Tax=Rhizobium tumorigenes TaxID=2041385 RepID=UPI00241FD80D|nr:DnaJ domain-containing protein [Rhizobium tumorigenes]WFS01476.1 DnaJ domain-containing protein [Rhizobium tumorigenes]
MSDMAYQQKAAIEHMRDPYKTLGVRQDADVDEIKAAWRSMAKAIHPDHNRDDPTATARFAEVGRAYETLKDPKKRSRYDQVINMSSAAKGNGPTIMQQRQAAREADERAKVARAKAERLMEELERANAQKAQKAATASAAQPSASPPPAADSTAAPETAEDMVERIFGARAAAQTEKPTTAQKAADAPEPETTEPAPPRPSRRL